MTVLKDSSDQNKKSSTKWNQNQKTKTEKKRRRPYLRNYKLLSVAGVSERQERGRESGAGGGQKLLRERAGAVE
ncbi:hypothetical protein FH972_004007 [Carpinus fangiana]|uniref:Uncharacterized protein n=1 Tax=Carpinus fangiana TaxID=176857 RepID=A0A5N6QLP7_9ROSI|nr:hypothetical protein FH972_004007 [Carpinus fangiana]